MVPMIFWIRIKSPETSFRLFIPLILVYLLLLIPYVICVLVYAFLSIAPESTSTARGYLIIAVRSPAILIAMKGIEIKVHSNDSDISMYVK